MKFILLIFFCLTGLTHSVAEVTQPDFLKGINSFTIYNQISPHDLDLALDSSLEQTLGKMGKIVNLRFQPSFEEKFYPAISNSTFLKLFLENWIVETTDNAKKKQFKVETHLVLQCLKRDLKVSAHEDSLITIWIAEEVFDFSSDSQTLINAGKQAVQNLAKKFGEAYQKENLGINNNLTFYVL